MSIPVALLRRLLFFIVSNFPCNYGRACKQYKSNPRMAHNIEIVHSILQEMLQLKNASALQYPTTIIIICFLSLQLWQHMPYRVGDPFLLKGSLCIFLYPDSQLCQTTTDISVVHKIFCVLFMCVSLSSSTFAPKAPWDRYHPKQKSFLSSRYSSRVGNA